MKPLSDDLRKRLVAVYEETEVSYVEVAARFHVSVSSVRRFVKQWRETGTVTPKPPANGHQPKIRDDGEAVLMNLVKTQVDASQHELCQLLATETGTLVSQPTLCRTLQRARITRKKRRSGPRSPTGQTSKRPDSTSRKR
jgi:transposase